MNTLAGDLKRGDIIEIDGQKYKVTDTEHVKPGKGGALMQTVLQNIEKPQKKELRFRVDEKINVIQIYEKPGTFLYKDGSHLVFLDKESLDEFRKNHIENSEFLIEGCDVFLLITSEDVLLDVHFPETIICEVDSTPGFIPGQSASSQEKNASLTNGATVKVPQYIKDGDLIKINTEKMTFISKA